MFLTPLLLAGSVHAQEFSLLHPGSVYATNAGVVESSSGELMFFVSTGQTDLIWLDASGGFLRSRTLDGHVREARATGGDQFFLAGTGWAAKIDNQGNFVWQFSGAQPSAYWNSDFSAIEPTANGGFVLAANYYDYDDYWMHNDVTGVVHRVNGNGWLLWSRREYRWNSSYETAVDDAVVLANGTIVTIGQYSDSAQFRVLSAFENNGNALWHQELGVGGHLRDLAATAGGGFAVLAESSCTDYIGSFDAQGSPLWQKTFDSCDVFKTKVTGTSDGGLVLGGEYWAGPGGGSNAFVTKLDPQGNVEWQRDLGRKSLRVLDLIERAGGGFAVVARFAGPERIGLVCLDAQGEAQGCPTVPVDRPLSDTSATLNAADYFGIASWSFEPIHLDSLPFAGLPVPFCHSEVGTDECTSTPNSTGRIAELTTSGSTIATLDTLHLRATMLPPNQLGLFLGGLGNSIVTPPGSSGPLCLSGASIHRYTPVLSTGAGEMGLETGTFLPGQGQILAGETWRFQAWFRDAGSTSNFTGSRAITFN